MPLGRIVAIAVVCVMVLHSRAYSQYQPPSEYLRISGDLAYTWTDGTANVVQVTGPVTIETDRARLSAGRAVIWLTPLPGTVLDQMRAEIALLGDASIEQGQVIRSGESLFVTTQIRGSVRITAEQRLAQNQSDTDFYREALALRPLEHVAPGTQIPKPQWPIQRPWTPPTLPPAPTTGPATQPIRVTRPVRFRFRDFETTRTADDRIAAVISGGVVLFREGNDRSFMELQADRAVLFTTLTSFTDAGAADRFTRIEDAVTSAYLEGDVRITYTPGAGRHSEQRLRAARVFYDFETDRAVLTDAILHTTEPQRNIPVTIRAETIRQLSRTENSSEFTAHDVQLSTSSFAVPSYSINADRAYIRQYDTGDPRLGQRVNFSSTHNTFQAFNIPVFYWPWAGGSVTERGLPLRELQLGSSRGFGPAIRTRWGLFETIGRPPPEDLDISYRLDYYGDRGPAGGVDVEYGGGFITETTRQPWNFQGEFTSYFAKDHGEDRLGRDRARIEPEDEFRYRVLWEHQHFFPQDWQLQLRGGLVSDPTFLEEWFVDDFNEGRPHDASVYLKRQRQTEAFTLLVNFQPNDFVTTSDMLQEQFEVERLPEVGYYRTGDSLFDDRFTFFSANTVSGLRFNESDATLAELGFRANQSPGLPSLGTTGVTDDVVWRGDFRQEIAYPFSTGQFRFMPYLFGRYTPYSDSPDGSDEHRVFVGTGLRITTAFWAVNNSASSDLFDIHRIRHVIEPELHLFTSASTSEREDVFVYDEQVDAINDISAVQIALRQRWQTKRGGAGRLRSVDFFTLNIEGNFFANQPDDEFLTPKMFRGLFFPSMPEASIPRNSINADALWRISDTTALVADVQYNLDEQSLATTSIGYAAQRDHRLAYFLGMRYIGEINSTIASLGMNYELSAKYALRMSQSFNLTDRRNQNSSATLVRKFDRFFMTFTFFYDAVDEESGFRIGLYPEGLGYGLTSDQFQGAFADR